MRYFFSSALSFTFTRLLLGAYWARKREAVLHPESTLSVIIDGSDQVNNGCPYYSEKTHAMDGKWKFRLHIYGVLVHGYSPFVYLLQNHVKQGTIGVFLELSSYLFDCSIILAGTNVTIECLEQTLHRLQQDGVKLPPHLNLQLDNTSKQNKNRSFLVLHQIF